MSAQSSKPASVPRRKVAAALGEGADVFDATRWLELGAVALACLALLLVLTVGLSAQEPAAPATPAPVVTPAQGQPVRQQAPDYSDPAWRERALRAHRARVSSILAERRQERQAQQAQQQQAQRPTPPPQPQSTQPSSEGPTFHGTAQIISEPLNSYVHVGDHFVTSLQLQNTAGAEVDHVRLSLQYDPQVIRPVRVSDREIRPLIAGRPTLNSDPHEGRVVYEASLQEPYSAFSLRMLTVEWEALVPTPRTRIDLSEGRGETTELERSGRDVLGVSGMPNDGTVGSEVAIRPLDDNRLRGALLLNDPESLRAVSGVEPRGGVELSLVTGTPEVQVGDILAIDVRLANPDQTPIDDLRFALRYDPRVLEALDAAPSDERHPGDNWIVGGVNLHDAPFHRDYPFDYHLANEADNGRGLAVYHMGLSQARSLPDGTVARAYFRALAPARRTNLTFVVSDDPTLANTSVRCLGLDVLGALETAGDGLHDLDLRVDPPAMTAQPAAHGGAPRI